MRVSVCVCVFANRIKYNIVKRPFSCWGRFRSSRPVFVLFLPSWAEVANSSLDTNPLHVCLFFVSAAWCGVYRGGNQGFSWQQAFCRGSCVV